MDGSLASPAGQEPALHHPKPSGNSCRTALDEVSTRRPHLCRKSTPDLAHFGARFERSLAQLNRGEMEEMLSRYSDEVTVLLPEAKPGDPVREKMIHGKAGFSHLLARFLAAYAPLRLLDVQLDPPTGVCAAIQCRGGMTMTYRLTFDAAGLGKRVVVSIA